MSNTTQGFWSSLAKGALTASLLIAAAHASAAAYSDFDGDPISDILWRNSATGQTYIFPMNSLTVKGTQTYSRTVADPNWRVVGVGDFNGDGVADILYRNFSTGENFVFLMNGLQVIGEGYITSVTDLAWTVAGVADVDGDGKADIIWRNMTTGYNYVFTMNGLAVKPNQGYISTVADLNWHIVGFGDFDGDGVADILWRHSVTGENYIFPMTATTLGVKASQGFTRTIPDPNWKVVGVGDFTGGTPSKADILWRNMSTGENFIMPMNGTAVAPGEGYINGVVDQNWQVVQVGDFDGDGKADILWRHMLTGQNYIFFVDFSTAFSVKPAQGYTTGVADLNWQVVPSAIQPALVASRVSGVAPLAVHFDATGTSARSTNRPFHELEYRWDFGDPLGSPVSGTTWGAGARAGVGSRNAAAGAVAVHVFERPGTYNVVLTVSDGAASTKSVVQITVQDPNVVFSGANTFCVRQVASGDFSGCPAGTPGGNQVTQASFATAISTYATAGKRVLFRRGDVWTPSGPAAVNPASATAGIIGAFGTGNAPSVASTGGNFEPILTVGGSASFADWRVMDISFDGSGGGDLIGVKLGQHARNVLLLRVTINQMGAGGFQSDEFAAGSIYSGVWLVDSTITNTSYAAYFAAEKAAVLGNTLTNTQQFAGVGVFRTQYFTKSVMSNNTMSGSPPGFHVLKFGAPRWSVAGDGGLPVWVGRYSELSLVSDNYFDDRTGTTGWMLPFGPENGQTEERVRDVIIERNWSRSGINCDNHYLVFNAVDITIRNNLMDMTDGKDVDQNGIGVADRGKGPLPERLNVFNNTIYRGDAASGPLHGIQLYDGKNIVVKNNLVSAPLTSNKVAVNADGSVTGFVQSNNLLSNAPGFVGGALPTTVLGFKLTAGSGASILNAGTVVPVFSDFFGVTRPNGSAIDLGAAEF